MSIMSKFKVELVLTFFALVFTIFLWSNFDPVIASATFAMCVLYWIPISRGKGLVPTFAGRQKAVQTLIIGIGVFVAWIFISGMILKTASGSTFSVFSGEVFSQMASLTQVPVLSDDPTMRILVYGVTIPIAETLFAFSFLLFGISALAKVSLKWNPNDPKMYWVVFIIAGLMAIFHFTVRRFSDVGLLVDFAFFALSGFLVFWRGQLAEAMLLHIANNTAVIISEG